MISGARALGRGVAMLLQDLMGELKDGLRRLAQDTACSVSIAFTWPFEG